MCRLNGGWGVHNDLLKLTLANKKVQNTTTGTPSTETQQLQQNPVSASIPGPSQIKESEDKTVVEIHPEDTRVQDWVDIAITIVTDDKVNTPNLAINPAEEEFVQ